MEIFDVVDEEGMPTGETVSREKAHALGVRHRTAHIWVVRKAEAGGWEVLLQKRAADKDSFPGCYDTSSAGHIHAGDEPGESAVRELGEELGIHTEAEKLQYAGRFAIRYEKEFHGKVFRDNEVSFVYVYDGHVDAGSLKLQKEEVEEVRWFKAEKVREALDNEDPRFCVPKGGFQIACRWMESRAAAGKEEKICPRI